MLLFRNRHQPKETWGQLYGASLSLIIAESALNHRGVTLLVAPDQRSAYQLQDNLRFFLAQAKNAPEILFFPDWETLPYEMFSPHQDLISDRLMLLSRLQQKPHAIVITVISTLMHRLCPVDYIKQYAFTLKVGQNLTIEPFREQLQRSGYYAVNKVFEHGEYAVRGAILDIFPMGSLRPLRIELFDNIIDSLREFDPETQRTIEKINSISILPARECPLNNESMALFRRQFREKFPGNPSQCPIYESISDQKYPGGIEYYLPLFFEKTATLFDYLPQDTPLFLLENIAEKAEQFWQDVRFRYEQRRHDISRPVLSPEIGFLDPTQCLTLVNHWNQVRIYHKKMDKKGFVVNFNTQKSDSIPSEPKPETRYLFVAESAGRREVLLERLQKNARCKTHVSWQAFLKDSSPNSETFHITIGHLDNGFELRDHAITVISEAQLFGDASVPIRSRRQKTIDPDIMIRDLTELNIGAPVVHLQFGVGRYLGLQSIATDGVLNDYLILSYANEDKIYVPVTALNLISRYTGSDSDHAPLNRLGTEEWQREKKKAALKIHDVAIELLDIYAKREANKGMIYQWDPVEYQRFVAGFPFIETPDQQRAINDIQQDMASERPMDRLICGDVGFGKTEVAMRAAFIAAIAGKQVCILTPTTLLAGQHFTSFQDRFADYPLHIDLLSRFRTAKEISSIIEKLQEGRIDIIIGTHKLLQKNIQFKNLGLLIIDEEHRFGVKQKEHIKALRTQVDILSMTATPIPRTLNLAMHSIRDISLMTTPPAKRLAIKTFWQEKNDALIREAILREIFRGGQVFFLHNNVQTIQAILEELQTLVPEAKMHVAHGQMRERELERIMSDFYHQRFNVLICTTIIETGIDIPTANTIIIDKADNFGLAQLHQLRGRVGRSHHQAYAYLFTPSVKLLTADAVKRLEALVQLENLGAGFALATHDLEIRGAGDLLGEEQSGNIHAIGFQLYMDMLDKTVSALKAGKTPELETPFTQGTDIDLKCSAIIPDNYIPDIHTRLIFYKRIANTQNSEDLRELQIELIDRFGLLPMEVKQLLRITELKQLATPLGISRIRLHENIVSLDLDKDPHINGEALIKLIQRQPKRYQLQGPTRLKMLCEKEGFEARSQEIVALINQLVA
jgi:transcription-repair coupling factor (superfamily II helicase)